MSVLSFLRLIVSSLLVASLCAQAQTYRWTDKDGKVHYTDTPPPPTAVTSQEKNLKGNVASSGDLPYATQEAMKSFPVKLYSKDKCPPCDEGRTFLNKRGIPFSEIAVNDDSIRVELQQLKAGGLLPVLRVGEEVKKGFDTSAWNRMLDLAGYPQTAIPGAKAQARHSDTEGETRKGPYAVQ